MKYIVNNALMLMLFCVGIQTNAMEKRTNENKNIRLEVIFDDDTREKPFLILFEKGINGQDVTKAGQKTVLAKNSKTNSFIFELKDLRKPIYFSIDVPGKKHDLSVLNEYLLEPGDQIKMHIKKTNLPKIFNYEFSGSGSAKYNCKYELRNIGSTILLEFPTLKGNREKDYNLNRSRHYIEAVHHILDLYKSKISGYSYNLLFADAIGWQGEETMSALTSDLLPSLVKKDTLACKTVGGRFFEGFNFDYAKYIPDSVLCDSKDYSRFILAEARCKALTYHPDQIYLSMYEEIKKTNNSAFRDKLIMGFLMKFLLLMNDHYNEIYTDAIKVIKDPYCLERVKEISRNNVGTKAYNFSLTDRNGKTVRLSDFKGKNVFIDFWFTGCVHCQHYFEQVVDSVEHKYKNKPNIVFITVSIDKDKNKWIQSLNEGKYTSDLAINLYTNGEGDKNGIIQYYNILGYPRPMLIDSEGKIVKLVGSELRRKEKLITELENMIK